MDKIKVLIDALVAISHITLSSDKERRAMETEIREVAIAALVKVEHIGSKK